MTLKQAEEMYYSLAKHYSVFGVDFKLMKRLSRYSSAGQCRYKKIRGNKVPISIELQPTFIEKNLPVVVRLTIIHELAHALNPKNGHGSLWKKSSILMGHTGKRFYNDKVVKR